MFCILFLIACLWDFHLDTLYTLSIQHSPCTSPAGHQSKKKAAKDLPTSPWIDPSIKTKQLAHLVDHSPLSETTGIFYFLISWLYETIETIETLGLCLSLWLYEVQLEIASNTVSPWMQRNQHDTGSWEIMRNSLQIVRDQLLSLVGAKLRKGHLLVYLQGTGMPSMHCVVVARPLDRAWKRTGRIHPEIEMIGSNMWVGVMPKSKPIDFHGFRPPMTGRSVGSSYLSATNDRASQLCGPPCRWRCVATRPLRWLQSA